jgi:hypothetical protein
MKSIDFVIDLMICEIPDETFEERSTEIKSLLMDLMALKNHLSKLPELPDLNSN